MTWSRKKKAPWGKALKIQWRRIRNFCHTGSKNTFGKRGGHPFLKSFSPNWPARPFFEGGGIREMTPWPVKNHGLCFFPRIPRSRITYLTRKAAAYLLLERVVLTHDKNGTPRICPEWNEYDKTQGILNVTGHHKGTNWLPFCFVVRDYTRQSMYVLALIINFLLKIPYKCLIEGDIFFLLCLKKKFVATIL